MQTIRHNKRRVARYATIVCVVGGAVALVSAVQTDIFGHRGHERYRASLPSIDESIFYTVTEVVDGDTFKVMIGSHEVTVRALGVDTPETVDPRKPAQCYGREASDMAKALLGGKRVRLSESPKRERTDTYGRYLAYVRLEDGEMYNEYVLRGGYAREYTYGKAYSLQAIFRALESEARAARVGLWGACPSLEPKKALDSLR